MPAGVLAQDAAEAARRFAVYRNNGAVSLSEALGSRFPVIRQLVGASFFAALARAYLETSRPRSPVLAEWGASFAAFLEHFPPLAAYPYLGDVARIEYARGRAFHAADAPPVDPRALAGADPDRVRLGLHPSVHLLDCAYPAVSIWMRNQPGAQPAPLESGPQTALILRDPAFQVPVRALGPGDAALLHALMAGATLTRAADMAQQRQAGHEPQPLLVSLMQSGAITEARE
ncbi:DUF2063 domain-containing protein [Rhodobacter sp. ETT8]|uniref:DUF2063 domain-containing protein n=1 Tax=Pseudotabrizicola algicola TaxID=2709381 RepID=A0A6B3RT06_9RHOB|nr:DUF2063 domain-containing protein [Pseudotabrizicola algicola]